MSKLQHDAFGMNAWPPEVSVVTRRPSWMARKMSTRPPAPSVPPPASQPPAGPSSVAPPPEPEASAASQELPRVVPDVDLASSSVIAQLADDNAALRAQVAEMASTMARLRRQILEASEGELVKLSLSIAERVVARELAIAPDLVVAWAREAIDVLAAKDEVVIAVAKEDLADMPGDAWDAIGLPYRVEHDPQLVSGAIEVRTPQGIVAVGAEARLSAVAAALGMAQS